MVRVPFVRVRVGLWPLVIAVVLGCGVPDEAEPVDEPAKAAPLTAAQIAAARQVGLLPGAFLPLHIIDPAPGQGDVTDASAINNAGKIVGYGHAASDIWYPSGYVSYPFTSDGGAAAGFPGPCAGGPAFPTAIDGGGWIAGYGGPPSSAGSWNTDLQHAFVRRADGATQLMEAPAPTQIISGTRASSSSHRFVGTTAVNGSAVAHWAFDGTIDDQFGVTMFDHPAGSQLPPGVTLVEDRAGHPGQAVKFNGGFLTTHHKPENELQWTGTGVTMMAWVHTSALCPHPWQAVVMRDAEAMMAVECNDDGTLGVM